MPRWYTSSGGNHGTPTFQETNNLFRDTSKRRSRCWRNADNPLKSQRIPSREEVLLNHRTEADIDLPY
jgi:hypothetical protein